jgi:hypothetical protein
MGSPTLRIVWTSHKTTSGFTSSCKNFEPFGDFCSHYVSLHSLHSSRSGLQVRSNLLKDMQSIDGVRGDPGDPGDPIVECGMGSP